MAAVQDSNEWYAGIPRSARMFTIFGFVMIAVSVFGFGGWASTALIAGAVVASGSFVATGENKIVQHFEGGVISEILVKEGDVVEQGQVLIRLDATSSEAELQRLLLREARASAIETRLIRLRRSICVVVSSKSVAFCSATTRSGSAARR